LKKLALLSVSDKTNILDLANGLVRNGYELLATGNTAKLLIENSIPVIKIEDFTSFPEIFDGRVKTLQPTIFGGILMRRDFENDLAQAEANNILPIDIVCVNLYPFPEVVKRDDIDLQTKIENIDIGGPSLIRAAAKNYKYVTVLTDPEQYSRFLTELDKGEVDLKMREELASAAFAHTSFYDTLIANFLEDEFKLPKKDLRINLPLKNNLRYGENPHQSAAIYGDFYNYFEILHGKELSFNNIVDLVAAVDLVNELEKFSCAIIKHTNPCGAATRENIYDAYTEALTCDPVSSFGGIVSFNEIVDEKTANKMNEIFLEIIVAPGFTPEALEILKKKKNRRLVKMLQTSWGNNTLLKSIPGGVVTQNRDTSKLDDVELKLVTERNYSEAELEDMKFAWVICKHTKSNTIIFAKDKKIVGVGAGQMSRIDSAKIAAAKAKEFGHDLKDAVAASDAFFPFPDGVEQIAKHNIKAIIQPGGSVRDDEVIKAANENKLSMVFTGIRNFKH